MNLVLEKRLNLIEDTKIQVNIPELMKKNKLK